MSHDGAFYRHFVAAFKHSGLTLSAYCRKHQMGESTFRKYLLASPSFASAPTSCRHPFRAPLLAPPRPYGLSQHHLRGPQGEIISPMLANIYLHYALDLWFEKVFRKD